MDKNLIKIDKKEALHYLGYKNQTLDEQTRLLLDQAAQDCIDTAKPKYIWQIYRLQDMDLYPIKNTPLLRSSRDIYDLLEKGESPKLAPSLLEKSNFQEVPQLHLPGRDIAKNLKGADYLVLFAASLGIEIDRKIAIYEHQSMTRALMLDACASSYIESICNICNQEVKEAFFSLSYKALPRFSPGYGDLPISLQNSFCQLLDSHRKIGLSCTGNHLLLPRKSVTAIIGLSKENQKAEKNSTPCSICFLEEHCDKRNCQLPSL